ncbi:MAG: hypothetical protein V3R30_02630, partial [Kiloniellales bacterium]
MEQDISSGVQDRQAIVLDYSLDLIGAVVILVVGWIVAGWIRVAVGKALSRLPNADATVTKALCLGIMARIPNRRSSCR